MKRRKWKNAGIGLVVLTLPLTGWGRLGEGRSMLERRLMADGSAIQYGEDRVESKLGDRGVPYRHLVELFPPECEHAFYYKKAGGEKVSAEDIAVPPSTNRRSGEVYPPGWDLHVVYLRNSSVFECYRLNRGHLNRFYIESLLKINGARHQWKRAEPGLNGEPSAIGYNYAREDGAARARIAGNMLMVFRTDLDETLLERLESVAAKELEGF